MISEGPRRDRDEHQSHRDEADEVRRLLLQAHRRADRPVEKVRRCRGYVVREIDALGKLVLKAVNFRAPQIGQHERTEQQHRRERRARERRNPAQHEAWLQDGDGDHDVTLISSPPSCSLRDYARATTCCTARCCSRSWFVARALALAGPHLRSKHFVPGRERADLYRSSTGYVGPCCTGHLADVEPPPSHRHKRIEGPATTITTRYASNG